MNNSQYLKDMETYGIATSNNLRQLLTTCQDPVEAIKNFQQANSLKLPSLVPAIKLLDLHGIRRVEYYETLSVNLSDQILKKIKLLGSNPAPKNILKLEQQLDRCFKLYRVPKVKPIVLECLKQLPKIADRYLKLIVCDKNLYNSCDVSVRQQIWIKNDSLFDEDANPVIDSYLEEKEKLVLSTDKVATNFFTCDTTKTRRQWKQVQELVSMIGEYEVLYKHLIDIIQERFLKTKNAHLCSLRMELLMSIHDINVDYAMKIDLCHDFAWCLDASIRDKHLDSQQSLKLKMILDGNKKELNKIIGSLAMISHDPHIINFLCSMIVKILRDNVLSSFSLPRENLSLQLVVKLLVLGIRAHEILSGDFNSSLLDVDVITRFLPTLIVFLSEDLLTYEMKNAPEELIDEFNANLLSNGLIDTCVDFLRNNEICALIWMYYLLDILPTKRRIFSHSIIFRYIQIFPHLCNKISFQDPWIHLFIYKLISANAIDPLITDNSISDTVISGLLINSAKLMPNIKFHLLRLCAHLKTSINNSIFEDARDVLISIYDEITFNSDCTILDLFFVKEFSKHKYIITSANHIKDSDLTQ